MKKLSRMAGVTLLEVMLVLAVAAMIIVMSIRYYQTATTNQQVNGALQMIQAISANADALAQGTGSYAGAVTTTAVQNLMPNNSMTAPWGGTATISGAAATQYTVNITSTPAAVCRQVMPRLAANAKITVTSACGSGAATFTYTYSSIGGS